MDKTGQKDDIIVEEFESESDLTISRLYKELKDHQKKVDRKARIRELPSASSSSESIKSDSESEEIEKQNADYREDPFYSSKVN